MNTTELWQQARDEAMTISRQEPSLVPLMLGAVLNRATLGAGLAYRLGHRLAHPDLAAAQLVKLFDELLVGEPAIEQDIARDLTAVLERDPAIRQITEVVLYLKGFHALSVHRFAHALWLGGRRQMARYLQSRSSEVFQTDIHPAAEIGNGVFIDHATGVVIGETTIIGDDVSLLQGVTLGGTGKEAGDRHPKIRRGVLIGAGAKVLGNIEIGEGARIGAGSVVLKPVPPCTTAVGVPARIIGDAGCDAPSREMQHCYDKSGIAGEHAQADARAVTRDPKLCCGR
ncbi:serine O-acetyltransferase [Salinicola rhizosphaerae]|uniref:Serine acetyltransferase n=1 Tax=Salinicola rhizosphaerae TaxID=1443141 RepID=A0ABQ3DSR3_9GAMM|nr:serine O-acetyltransferase [Salinicola rhizosphaerae]GHB14688.1 serine acetyltransferase [Salinicola rhizosphaerae]